MDRDAVAVPGHDVPVEAVVGDVELAVVEPLRERARSSSRGSRVNGLVPVQQLAGLVGPEAEPVGGGRSTSSGPATASAANSGGGGRQRRRGTAPPPRPWRSWWGCPGGRPSSSSRVVADAGASRPERDYSGPRRRSGEGPGRRAKRADRTRSRRWHPSAFVGYSELVRIQPRCAARAIPPDPALPWRHQFPPTGAAPLFPVDRPTITRVIPPQSVPPDLPPQDAQPCLSRSCRGS